MVTGQRKITDLFDVVFMDYDINKRMPDDTFVIDLTTKRRMVLGEVVVQCK